MTWNPILVGVDGSPESVRAAVLGALIAERARTTCQLVHAAPDYWTALSVAELGVDLTEIDRASQAHSRALIAHSLDGAVPAAMVKAMEVRIGRGPIVLAEAAARVAAEIVVLGGKHHRALARLGGSTVTHMVRLGAVPVLATDGTSPVISRVLVAVDLSYAAKPAIDVAERWAALFGARLRVLHVVEPMPVVPGLTLPVADEEVYRSSTRLLETAVAPLVTFPGAEVVSRRGRAAAAIATEVEQWHADLVVLGSHGKGWVDRLLIGSTSERLLQVLPAPTLVVPVARPRAEARRLDVELPWAEAGVAR